ncbi:hypothetical protein Tco_1525279 [Tanacetum coccineum]
MWDDLSQEFDKILVELMESRVIIVTHNYRRQRLLTTASIRTQKAGDPELNTGKSTNSSRRLKSVNTGLPIQRKRRVSNEDVKQQQLPSTNQATRIRHHATSVRA